MKLGFVFPGQGSQKVGMGLDLCASFPLARELYEQASTILGYNLLRACENRNGELNDTKIVQPAILVHSVVCWRLLQQSIEQPIEAVTGHSLGEMSAVVCAGGLGFAEAVSLVKLRAELMASCEEGGMLLVFALPEEPIARACAEISAPGHYITIANHNAAEQWVLSGHRKALQEAALRLESLGGVVKELNISIAAHSILMAPVLSQFEEAIDRAPRGNCLMPVLSCISGTTYMKREELAPMLSKQLIHKVDWPLTTSRLLERGIDTLVELGPKTVLRDLIRIGFPDICALSFGTAESKSVVERLISVKSRDSNAPSALLQRSQCEAFLRTCLRIIVGTPTLKEYSAANFKQRVQGPYQEIIEDLDMLGSSGEARVEVAIIRRAARQTLDLLRAKGINAQQSVALFQQSIISNEIQDALIEYLS